MPARSTMIRQQLAAKRGKSLKNKVPLPQNPWKKTIFGISFTQLNPLLFVFYINSSEIKTVVRILTFYFLNSLFSC
jgi:hypothetical protein